jgi:hypothetical protein
MAIQNAIPFGMASEAGGFEATESVSLTNRADKMEQVGADGNIFSVCYYNFHGDFTATGFKGSAPSATLGSALSATGSDATSDMKPGLTGANGAGAGGGVGEGASIFISEIQVEESAEEFQKFTLKGQWWSGY